MSEYNERVFVPESDDILRLDVFDPGVFFTIYLLSDVSSNRNPSFSLNINSFISLYLYVCVADPTIFSYVKSKLDIFESIWFCMLEVTPSNWLIYVGDTEIGVVNGDEKGTSVPEQSARLMVLSAVASIADRVISKSSTVVPSKMNEFKDMELIPDKLPPDIVKGPLVNEPSMDRFWIPVISPLSRIVKEPFVNEPSIDKFRIPAMSLLESIESISPLDAAPGTIPDNKFISSGVAEIVVVDGDENGISVPSALARLIYLSWSGSIAFKFVLTELCVFLLS